jgi:hypothetical protein
VCSLQRRRLVLSRIRVAHFVLNFLVNLGFTL